MLKRISHVALIVKDYTKSINFYVKHFGFEIISEREIPSPTLKKIAFLKLGDTTLELLNMPDGPSIQGSHFCIESDSFDEDYNRLKSAGIPVDVEPSASQENGPKRAVFIGPDGESIEVTG